MGRPTKKKKPVVNKNYRPASSYRAKTPEAKARQMSGLKQFSGKVKNPAPMPKAVVPKDCTIIEFAVVYLGISFAERPAQEVVLRSLYGLPLDEAQTELYRKLTTNDEVFEPDTEKTEADLAIGARGGKSLLASIIALYEAIVKADHWREYLRRGEVGRAVIIATRQQQAQDIIQASCTNLLENSSLNYYIDGDPTKAELLLTNGMAINSAPCNSTAYRGAAIFLLIFDEICHFRVEGVKADETIHNALRPRQAQFPGAKCLKISTVAGKQGLFWDEFDEGFQVPSRLTIQANTRLVNPVIPQEFIDKEYKRDPDNAAREFGSIFAETVEGFFESCMDKLRASFGLTEDVPYNSCNRYYAACDQSGLSGRDTWGFAICHQDHFVNRIVQDVGRSWATQDHKEILAKAVDLCSSYKIGTISIDRYASGIVESMFKGKGLEVVVREKLPVIFQNFKTLIRGEGILLQDDPRLRRGLMSTQAFFGKSQNISIVHERTREGHADVACAVVTAVYDVSRGYSVSSYGEPVYVSTRAEDDAMCEYDVLRLL